MIDCFFRPALYGIVTLILLPLTSWAQGTGLQGQLSAEGTAALVKAARTMGDAQRGAIVFHQPSLSCAKCHAVGQAATTQLLGPDLTKPETGFTAESLVESVLDPSKVIRKGFEPVIVQLNDGTTLTGMFVEESPEELVLRDVGRQGQLVTLKKSDIEERVAGKVSIMPAGQVNILASRQQFLDLIRYLIEIAERGADRAKQLQPPPSLFAVVIPEYEKVIDHAGLLQDLDDKSFRRGEAIYNRLCINCHGTRTQPGSLPTSLKFAEGKFKNGSDPFRMYQTLTHGFGLMAPQTWMVPQQKYDVIHYVRETFLKPYNASQYAAVDKAYLDSLPKGTTRGPASSNVEPWSSMNYGPYLMATYEVGSDGSNFAQKGIAVRLDAGPGGVSRGKQWQVFDHDTLRMAAGWSASTAQADNGSTEESSNFIDWHGINFDGRHQIHPRISGQLQYQNPTGPGWANPDTGSFEDTRLEGRDHRRYGPLVREWGRFRGVFQYGDQIVLSYTVGEAEVLEMPGVAQPESDSDRNFTRDRQIFTRTFQIGPRSKPMLLKVASHPGTGFRFKTVPSSDRADATHAAVLEPAEGANSPASAPAVFAGKTYLEVKKGEDFDLAGRDYTIAARIKTKSGGTIFCQAPKEGPWAPDGKTLFIRGGRLSFDIGWVGVVTGKSNIADDQWHDVVMTWQHETGRVRLFVDKKLDGQGVLKPKNPAEGQVIRIGFTSPNFPDPTWFVGQMESVKFFQTRLVDQDIRESKVEGEERPLAHWKFESTGKDFFPDSTQKGHDAQVKGLLGSLPTDPSHVTLASGLSPMPNGAKWQEERGSLVLRLPAGQESLRFVLSVTTLPGGELISSQLLSALVSQLPLDLENLTRGGPRRWLDQLKMPVASGPEDGPFAVDVFSLPTNNPWFAQLRLTGFDFYPDGDRMAVCSWDGDVWIVSGLLGHVRTTEGTPQLTWARVANGLFQPLGLKIVDGQIYVTCRDQIALLKDLNGDGEADLVECFNSDHQVTEHFHEFAMGLQTDADGNFYYAKSGRHALDSVVPHHGTLLRVSRDGSRTDILATGFRAANGVCLNPDRSFVVTDQEGFWNPKNRINWVIPPGPGEKPRFYGNMYGFHEAASSSDSDMEPPLCWITNVFDRSPAELLWVTSKKWGALNGSLLNLSYGYGKIFVVPFEKSASQAAGRNSPVVQGGMCELPLPILPTGVMRGRFHPIDGDLYTCGMFAWAGNATQPGGFYRIRATGRPMFLPIGLSAGKKGMRITFSHELDARSVGDHKRFMVRTWSLKRSKDYGSKHYDEKTLNVASSRLESDQRTVFLELPEIQPTWSMSIEYELSGSQGEPVKGMIHNTIHWLNE